MKKKKKQDKLKHIDAETEFIRMTMCDSPTHTPWQALVEIAKGKNISEMFFELSEQSQHEVLDYMLWESEQKGREAELANTWKNKVREIKIK
jgi:hypothetical protein